MAENLFGRLSSTGLHSICGTRALDEAVAFHWPLIWPVMVKNPLARYPLVPTQVFTFYVFYRISKLTDRFINTYLAIYQNNVKIFY